MGGERLVEHQIGLVENSVHGALPGDQHTDPGTEGVQVTVKTPGC
ncbi:hypothetical protein [Streptomyces sp. FxanaA7]|nr:hypothetical protein [Streptomyces sp. FxanaA7]